MDPPVSQTLLRCESTFTQPGVFSRLRRAKNTAHRAGGGKKKFTHKATPARCASQHTRSCCIFLGSYMLSFDTQRSHGVRDAPSHGNSPGARSRGARSRFNSEEYQTACGYPTLRFTLGHNDQSMVCGVDFCSSPLSILQPFSVLHGVDRT